MFEKFPGTSISRCRLQVSPNGLEVLEVTRTRAYLGFLLVALALALFASPAQAHQTCCCEPVAAEASCCCCEEGPAETLSSCVMSCEQPTRHNIGFLIQVPPGFLPCAPAVSLELPRPPRKPAPPKSLVSRVIEEWAPPPSPPIASLNISLPPPSSLLL